MVLTKSLEPLPRRLPGQQGGWQAVPASDMCVEAAGPSLRARFCFTNLMVAKGSNGEPSVQSGSGYLLIDLHP